MHSSRTCTSEGALNLENGFSCSASHLLEGAFNVSDVYQRMTMTCKLKAEPLPVLLLRAILGKQAAMFA